jgi:hypothetical protein
MIWGSPKGLRKNDLAEVRQYTRSNFGASNLDIAIRIMSQIHESMDQSQPNSATREGRNVGPGHNSMSVSCSQMHLPKPQEPEKPFVTAVPIGIKAGRNSPDESDS